MYIAKLVLLAIAALSAYGNLAAADGQSAPAVAAQSGTGRPPIGGRSGDSDDPEANLPQRLSETGLFVPGTRRVRPGLLRFSPQYPLWSDGATKRRWLYLPLGTAIDTADPDVWVFPPGTRLWKEFGYRKPVETRLIERLEDGSWRYLAFVWQTDGSDASLAPSGGIARHPAEDAPGGNYVIPSREDCRACHEGGTGPVLGVNALQLSPDRDALAPHAEPVLPGNVDLRSLMAYGLLANVSPSLLGTPPGIRAASPEERAALGYMHANCGHCHNERGPLASLELPLAQEIFAHPDGARRTRAATTDRVADTWLFGLEQRIVPGRPGASLLAARMGSRNPYAQMPPLGTRIVDSAGLATVEQWINQLIQPEDLPP